MSYDIYLIDKDTKETVEFNEKQFFMGGTYQAGGTREAWLNVTYNYGKHFRKVLGEEGIRTIYGMTGAESRPILLAAIGLLNDDENPDYWEPTEGNARKALINLWQLANAAPEGIWDGD